jgi:hypothetical protein
MFAELKEVNLCAKLDTNLELHVFNIDLQKPTIKNLQLECRDKFLFLESQDLNHNIPKKNGLLFPEVDLNLMRKIEELEQVLDPVEAQAEDLLLVVEEEPVVEEDQPVEAEDDLLS